MSRRLPVLPRVVSVCHKPRRSKTFKTLILYLWTRASTRSCHGARQGKRRSRHGKACANPPRRPAHKSLHNSDASLGWTLDVPPTTKQVPATTHRQGEARSRSGPPSVARSRDVTAGAEPGARTGDVLARPCSCTIVLVLFVWPIHALCTVGLLLYLARYSYRYLSSGGLLYPRPGAVPVTALIQVPRERSSWGAFHPSHHGRLGGTR